MFRSAAESDFAGFESINAVGDFDGFVGCSTRRIVEPSLLSLTMMSNIISTKFGAKLIAGSSKSITLPPMINLFRLQASAVHRR